MVMFVRMEEVVVINPESQVIVSIFDVVETVCITVRSFIGWVQVAKSGKLLYTCGMGIWKSKNR